GDALALPAQLRACLAQCPERIGQLGLDRGLIGLLSLQPGLRLVERGSIGNQLVNRPTVFCLQATEQLQAIFDLLASGGIGFPTLAHVPQGLRQILYLCTKTIQAANGLGERAVQRYPSQPLAKQLAKLFDYRSVVIVQASTASRGECLK